MAMQNEVRTEQAVGIVGDIVLEGSVRACPCVLKSTNPENNIVGRGFCYVEDSDTDVSADSGSVFAGILANSKTYALQGKDGLFLEPGLALPNSTNVELVTMTSGVLVELSTVASVGDHVFYNPLSGILAASASETLADHVLIPDARIVRKNISGSERLAIVQLN